MASRFCLRASFTWLAGCALLAAGAAPAFAQTCEAQPNQATMVQSNLQRLAKEGDFPTAQDYAERTRRGFDQLAAQARRCECAAAQAQFEDAALRMRAVRLADNRKPLREAGAAAAKLLDAGLAEQRKCAGF